VRKRLCAVFVTIGTVARFGICFREDSGFLRVPDRTR
jgi:hypothetical protein